MDISPLLRTLETLDEPFAPLGAWYRGLIAQCAEIMPDRPAILDPETAELAQTTRGFRNWATRQYTRRFDLERARHAARAAEKLSQRLPQCLAAFQQRIDPQEQAGLDPEVEGASEAPEA